MEFRVHTASFLFFIVTETWGSLVNPDRVLSGFRGRRRKMRFYEAYYLQSGVRPGMASFSGNTDRMSDSNGDEKKQNPHPVKDVGHRKGS